jgi:cyclase
MMRTCLAFAAALVMAAAASHAQQPAPAAAPAPPIIDWEKIQIRTTDLGNKTYMLEGQGGNITVAVGSDGILMVDGQFAPLSDKVKAAIREIAPLPIKYLVNTHYHGDHTGGNDNFAKDGAVIVAHDNIRVRLAAGTRNGLTGATVPPRAPEALPKQTYFGGSFTLEVGGRTAQLTHIANAHTDGDTWVYFADANVLSTGDTFNNLKRYQNIDFANGGDVRGMIRALDTYLKVANDSTRSCPATARSRPRPISSSSATCWSPRATASRSCSTKARASRRWSPPGRWPISMRPGATTSSTPSATPATSTTRSSGSERRNPAENALRRHGQMPCVAAEPRD